MLLDYESDAKLAQSQGKPVFYLIPKATLQIETPLAAPNSSNKAAAQQFVNWLYTPAAQTIWAQNGFRPVDPKVAKRYKAQFPPRPQLFTIGYVGGWTKVDKQFFDPTNGHRREDRADRSGSPLAVEPHSSCRGPVAGPSARLRSAAASRSPI